MVNDECRRRRNKQFHSFFFLHSSFFILHSGEAGAEPASTESRHDSFSEIARSRQVKMIGQIRKKRQGNRSDARLTCR
jgi:hypothetical protein